MNTVKIHNRSFDIYLESSKLDFAISNLAQRINADYGGKNPLFVGVLNGAFRFAADLMKYIDIDCEINFVKLSSYRGTESTGRVNNLIGLNSDIGGRHVVILEDIVDTGHTWDYLNEIFLPKSPASLKIATLLYKPEPYQSSLPVDYVGFEIPNLFVVGYGLDYDGQGRNLNDIYQIKS